jgi:hypothetical protein
MCLKKKIILPKARGRGAWNGSPESVADAILLNRAFTGRLAEAAPQRQMVLHDWELYHAGKERQQSFASSSSAAHVPGGDSSDDGRLCRRRPAAPHHMQIGPQ